MRRLGNKKITATNPDHHPVFHGEVSKLEKFKTICYTFPQESNMKPLTNKYKWINTDTDGLFDAVMKIETLDEARRFFRDLLTDKEIIEFAQRWKVARLLAKNKKYTEIEKETGMSSKTIARIQKWLTKGMGGYRLMINKLKNSKS